MGMRKRDATEKRTVLYRVIYEDLKSKIQSNEFQDGEKLPFERELCDKFGVDRVTVRKALELLVADDLLEKRAGLGSFVKHPGRSQAPDVGSASRNILFVMYDNANEVGKNPHAFNAQLFFSIEQKCRLKNYSLFYAVLDEQSGLADILNGNSFAGILFVSYIPRHILEQCVKMGLPAICLNNRYEDMISIVSEDERGAYEAVKYLQGQGHSRIGILLGKREYYSTAERYRGYKAAMHDVGLATDPRHVMEGDWTFDGARRAVFAMLDALPPDEVPTAIFCCSDMMAIGAMDALKERDYSIPKSISVMGFDNIQQAEYIYPRLTTVSTEVQHMVELAVDKIISFNAGAANPVSRGYVIQIPSVLKIRQSVAALP